MDHTVNQFPSSRVPGNPREPGIISSRVPGGYGGAHHTGTAEPSRHALALGTLAETRKVEPCGDRNRRDEESAPVALSPATLGGAAGPRCRLDAADRGSRAAVHSGEWSKSGSASRSRTHESVTLREGGPNTPRGFSRVVTTERALTMLVTRIAQDASAPSSAPRVLLEPADATRVKPRAARRHHHEDLAR